MSRNASLDGMGRRAAEMQLRAEEAEAALADGEARHAREGQQRQEQHERVMRDALRQLEQEQGRIKRLEVVAEQKGQEEQRLTSTLDERDAHIAGLVKKDKEQDQNLKMLRRKFAKSEAGQPRLAERS